MLLSKINSIFETRDIMKREKLGRVGCNRKQRIEGISPITYGWIDKSDLKKFYTTIGCHSKIQVVTADERFINRLHSKLNRDIFALTRDIFKDIRYSIIDIDIPANCIKTHKGFITVDVTIDSKVDITPDVIELFNKKVVDILISNNRLTIFPSNKYIS